MKYRIKLDLLELVSQTLTNGFSLMFNNISNLSNWYDEEEIPDITNLEIYVDSNATKYLYVFYDGGSNPDYDFHDGDIINASATQGVINFDCEIELNKMADLLTLISKGIVILDWEGYTSMILYRQNSANNVVSKSLTLKAIIQGKFNIPVGLKNINLDLEGTLIDFDSFNYVYIPIFERYYYVNSVQLVTDKIVRYVLGEDVLMSWSTLIKTQSAFITRQESSANRDSLIDNRLPMKDTVSFYYYNPTHLSQKNISFSFLNAEGGGSTGYSVSKYNILVSTYTKEQYTNSSPYPISAPLNSGLPDISPLRSANSFKSLIQLESFGALINACVKDDTTASYVLSAIWLPFNPIGVFPHTQLSTKGVFANGKVLDGTNGGTWENYGSETLPVNGYWIHDGVSPYLIAGDFYFNNNGGISINDGIKIYKPYSTWEIYVPFVGWVEVDINKVLSKRIQIIYGLDLDTGLSTVYIYNWTDKVVIWSTSCQIGIKLNISTSNELENTKQKQANDLNMILGALSSVVSIGIGVATENPVAMVGGVLSAGKTIASAVNANNMIFDRASMNFGTSNTALYSNKDVQVRRCYHDAVSIDASLYAKINGYPANTYSSLSTLSGYTEIGDIQFNPSNYAISQDEINEIVALLRNGVIL